jgi:hypothetical protein
MAPRLRLWYCVRVDLESGLYVCMPQLALQNRQRDGRLRQLGGEAMPEPVQTSFRGRNAELTKYGGRRFSRA